MRCSRRSQPDHCPSTSGLPLLRNESSDRADETRRLQVWTSPAPKYAATCIGPFGGTFNLPECPDRRMLTPQIGSPGGGGSRAVEICPAHAFEIEEFAGRIDFPVFCERKGILLQLRTERSF